MNDIIDNLRISHTNGKLSAEILGQPDHIPDDYYTGEWIEVVNKNKQRKLKRKQNREKEAKVEELKKLREKKIEERKNAPLWYDSNTWQYKILTGKYKFQDGTSLIEKYNLEELHQSYMKARNNYKRNGICGKLMRIVTKAEWELIKDTLVEEKVEEEEKEVDVVEIQETEENNEETI